MNNENKNLRRILFITLLFICVIANCFFRSYSYTIYSDFTAINGSFQNYNVVRRFLSGQIPYRDFYPYLGLGHLVWGSLYTALLGGSYGASVFAFELLSSLVVFLLVFVLCISVMKNRFGINAYYVSFIIYGIYNTIIKALYNLELINFTNHTGNSARFIRGGALLVFVLMEWVMLKIIEKKIHDKNKRIPVLILGTSVVSGIVLPWSNDYGLACFICAMLFAVFMVIIKTQSAKSAILSFFSFPFIGGLSSFITVSIVTKGHFYEWLRQNFVLKSYQNWYFVHPTQKAFYIYDIDTSFLSFAALLLSLFYLFMCVRKREEENCLRRYGILAFTNLTCFATTNEYKLLGGGNIGIYEVLTLVVIVSILIELCHLLLRIRNLASITFGLISFFSSGIVFCMLILSVVMFYHSESTKMTNCYFAPLDGYFEMQYDDLISTYDFVNGKRVFSEYASAVEASTGQFQPSGTDYIIHCLNDESREKYLRSFHETEIDYVTTIKETYSSYGYWIRNANWFFMREVLSEYHIVWENRYEYFWERNADETSSTYEGEIVVNVNKLDDQHTEITIDALPVDNGIADVYIDYSAKKASGIGTLFIHNYLVGIESYDHGSHCLDSWGLRPESCEYIPVEIHNGKGKIMLTSLPANATELTVNVASCNRVFLI